MGEWAALDTQKILLFCRDDNMFVLEDHFLSKDYYYDCTNILYFYILNKLSDFSNSADSRLRLRAVSTQTHLRRSCCKTHTRQLHSLVGR